MGNITIDLLRHGEAASGKRLLGVTDEPLTELGRSQMHAIYQHKDIPWERVVSSPLQRCLSFASPLSAQHSLPLDIEQDFQEMDFGHWDGQLLADLYNGPGHQDVMAFFNDPASVSPPNGERFADFEARVVAAWERLYDTLLAEKCNHAVIITHGGVIKVILKQVLGLSADNLSRLAVANACLTRIQRYPDYPPRLIFHGGAL